MHNQPHFKPFLALSAAAGSGKTFALSVRYISLLFMGESPSTILAATFTNKAAAEMRQRVVESLRNLGGNEAFLNAVITQTGMDRATLFAKQPEVLNRFLSQSGYIVTLDSFFASVLRSGALELGLEPDFVTKEQGEESLEMHFLDEVAAQGLLSDLVRLAIDIEDKRFGKLFDLMGAFYMADPLLPTIEEPTEAIGQIVQEIEQLREQIAKLLVTSGASQTAINNFIPRPIKALFARDIFAKSSLLEARNYKKYVLKYPQIDEHFVALKARLLQWAQTREALVLSNLFKIYTAYKNATIHNAKQSSVLTFDDLTYFTYRLLYESISREFLYFKLDAKFKHILLDEFQDTSTLQFLLLRPLIDEIFAGVGQSDFRSFFYVGDTKQSLYRFRGGVEELFDKVAEDYGIEVQPMDTNYRSSQTVISQVNHWFAPVMPGYLPQKSREGAPEGFVEVIESDTLIEEAIAQAQRILALGVGVDDIAFLVATNKDGQMVQEACEAVGIKTRLKTTSSLKHIPKIAALVAMVAYLFEGEQIDAEAMLQYVGKDLEAVDLGWFSPFLSPVEVVDRLVREFGYFAEDLNIIKLLEFAAGYRDIPEFIDAFATSNIALASNTVHGAQIMTIHGSKGLEFDYVIVVDKLTGTKPDNTALLYHYDPRLHIDRIYYRTKGREHFDPGYAQIIEARKTASRKDRLNLLYVALTRAVEGLIVLRKPKDSVFDLLGMEVTQRGRLTAKSPSTQATPTIHTPPVTLTSYGAQSPVDRSEEEEIDTQAIRFGTALHYTLEMMADFTPESLPSALGAMRSRYGTILNQEEIDDIRSRITQLLEDRRFQSMLEGATISRERALSYQGELKQIDLLLAYPDCYLVIDYKSSQKGTLKHQHQVAHYLKAIEALTGKPTSGVIVYLEKEGICFKYLN